MNFVLIDAGDSTDTIDVGDERWALLAGGFSCAGRLRVGHERPLRFRQARYHISSFNWIDANRCSELDLVVGERGVYWSIVTPSTVPSSANTLRAISSTRSLWWCSNRSALNLFLFLFLFLIFWWFDWIVRCRNWCYCQPGRDIGSRDVSTGIRCVDGTLVHPNDGRSLLDVGNGRRHSSLLL